MSFANGWTRERCRRQRYLRLLLFVNIGLTNLQLVGGTPNAAVQKTAGVWVGVVRAAKISEPRSPLPSKPRLAGSVFEFPVILHVDPAGKVRLLKEVVILSSEDGQEDDRAFVDPRALPSDPEKLNQARRFATAAIDFPGAALPMEGRFEVGGAVAVDISLTEGLPTHPFAHRYHPDHDNLDDSYAPLAGSRRLEEIYTVGRAIELRLQKRQGEYVRGVYRERLSGLHKEDLFVSGTFRLERVASATNIVQ